MRTTKELTYYTLLDVANAILQDDNPNTFSDYVIGQMPSSGSANEEALIQSLFKRYKDDGFCYDEPTKYFDKFIVWVRENWEQIKLLGASIPTDYFSNITETSTIAISEHPQSASFSLAPTASYDKMSNLSQSRNERPSVLPYERIQTLKDSPIAWWDVYFKEYERRFVCNNTEEWL